MVIEAFKTLSTKLNNNAVLWRYDPIFYNSEWNMQRHIKEFSKIAEKLKGYTKVCTISFLQPYPKIQNRISNIYTPTKQQQIELLKSLEKIANQNGMKLKVCHNFDIEGFDCNGCQTKDMIEKAIGVNLVVSDYKNPRECKCLLGNDIGAYNSCGHLCKYCYANNDEKIVLNNIKKHDVNSPLLLGNITKNDLVVQAKQKSYLSLQLKIDF